MRRGQFFLNNLEQTVVFFFCVFKENDVPFEAKLISNLITEFFNINP